MLYAKTLLYANSNIQTSEKKRRKKDDKPKKQPAKIKKFQSEK